jgi:microcystin-dependent protein
MPEPYVGEIRMFAGNFPPNGWMFCQGQTMSIAENDALFTLIGTTYGGDGLTTFNLPDLSSRIPIHMGTGPDGTTYQIGEKAGTEQETLTTQQMPTHTHAFTASLNVAGGLSPNNAVTGESNSVTLYRAGTAAVALSGQAIGSAGGSQPHENCQPFLAINFIISLFGVFPSQT